MIYIGIDPGANGGMAVLWPDGDMTSYSFGDMTLYEVAEELLRCSAEGKVRAALEFVTRPAKLTHHAGILEGILIATGTPFQTVRPQGTSGWQAALQLRKVKSHTPAKHKTRLLNAAQAMYPAAGATRATADAILLAEWCRRNWGE